MLARAIGQGEAGGVSGFSLKESDAPRQVARWPQEEPRDMGFIKDRLIVPCSGSGIYTLDVSRPERIAQIAHWYVSWPNAGKHGGYPVTAAAAGDYAYIGTTGGNNPECEDFRCPYRGGRVYAVRIFTEK
jgi:hypothetical protein